MTNDTGPRLQNLALMQPYIFPYPGYFQLIAAVDKFVLYDDVSFIKGGWINRNAILINNERQLFSVPLKKASSFSLINETGVNQDLYRNWKMKFLKTVEHAYAKAPYFYDIYPLVAAVFADDCGLISHLATESIASVCQYLDVTTEIKQTSTDYDNKHLKGQERVLDICKREGTATYINAIGGLDLYSQKVFLNDGIRLKFLKAEPKPYKQFGETFIPNLSVIDALMFNSREQMHEMLKQYILL